MQSVKNGASLRCFICQRWGIVKNVIKKPIGIVE